MTQERSQFLGFELDDLFDSLKAGIKNPNDAPVLVATREPVPISPVKEMLLVSLNRYIFQYGPTNSTDASRKVIEEFKMKKLEFMQTLVRPCDQEIIETTEISEVFQVADKMFVESRRNADRMLQSMDEKDKLNAAADYWRMVRDVLRTADKLS